MGLVILGATPCPAADLQTKGPFPMAPVTTELERDLDAALDPVLRATGRPVAGGHQFRRAVVLMLMTLVLPGSAQLVAGRRQTGRVALRIWAGLLATVVVLFALGALFSGFVFWLVSNTVFLGLVRFVLMGLAVGWAYLFIDAWRLGDPLALRQKQRLAMVGINGVLCFTVAGSLLFASHVVGVQKDFMGAMFTNGAATAAHDGRYNVLLLGGDSGADRWGLRPDSISVASIDSDTGKTVLFGLPRNMLNFPFAKGSIMHEQFPDGYDCGPQCELNSHPGRRRTRPASRSGRPPCGRPRAAPSRGAPGSSP